MLTNKLLEVNVCYDGDDGVAIARFDDAALARILCLAMKERGKSDEEVKDVTPTTFIGMDLMQGRVKLCGTAPVPGDVRVSELPPDHAFGVVDIILDGCEVAVFRHGVELRFSCKHLPDVYRSEFVELGKFMSLV